MDASLCREHLGALLTEELATLDALATLLKREFSCIGSGEVETLDQLGRERDACMNRLLHLDAERQALCRASSFATDKNGVMQMIRWCDPSGKLRQYWQRSTTAIRHCRNLNDRNGALVNSRLRRLEGQLQLLNATPENARVYSARGNAYQNPQAGRVCNVSA